MEWFEHTQSHAPRAAVGTRCHARGSIYGPLMSRRLGWSLGIDLVPPDCRACTFDCVYCEIPRLGRRVPSSWPRPSNIGAALASALRHCRSLDSITISGRGEPTLHPEFGSVVGRVLAEARGAQPGVPVRILTNGTEAVRPEIRRALGRLDECIVTLDAAAHGINRPHRRSPLGSVLFGIALLRDVTLQSCFVDGVVSNAGEEAVGEWIELIGELRPARVQIYTVNRKPWLAGVMPVAEAQLEEIARALRRRTGITTRAFA